jgi:succinate dehydrogenase/fumarate reductase flavoprotein subunit
MADPKLAQILVEEAVETRIALINMGISFEGWGIRSHGVPIMDALIRKVKELGIRVYERTMSVNLLVQNGECVGAVGINEISGEILVVNAKATIIASGGDANLFLLNLNPPDNTGDAYTMGYLAGAELMNLEFKQVFLGTVYPTRNMLVRMLHPHVKLLNVEGEEFLQKYLPGGASPEDCLAQRQLHNPFSTRDTLSKYIDISVIGEVKAGRGTQHHGVYLDRSDPRVPSLDVRRHEFWLYRGIDFMKGRTEIGPCHHCSLGGFRIDENGQTTIPHLYAAGESAAGPHGADRMGGHMLLASQVFGARAGKHGATYAKHQKLPDLNSRVLRTSEERIKSLKNGKGDQNPRELKRVLQSSAYYNLLITRSKEKLTRFLSEVRALREEMHLHLSIKDAQELIEAVELENLLLLAELEGSICLERTESRGPHYREDFPEQDDRNWLKTIIVKRTGDKFQLNTIVLDPTWKNKGDDKVRMWG